MGLRSVDSSENRSAPEECREVAPEATALFQLGEDFRRVVNDRFRTNPAFREEFQEQLDLLLSRPEELLERDVVLIIDNDPSTMSAIRKKLRPRGFMLTLIAKDGRVNLRKPFPWDVREISHAIDKWPIRQQEIRDRNAAVAE